MGFNWPPYEVKMSFLRDWGGVFETTLDVAKGPPRSFATVPIKHFGTLLGHILEDFGD